MMIIRNCLCCGEIKRVYELTHTTIGGICVDCCQHVPTNHIPREQWRKYLLMRAKKNEKE